MVWFWIAIGLVALLVFAGYMMYRMVFIRKANPEPPVPGSGKTAPRRYFTTHFAQSMQRLEDVGYETVTIRNADGQQLVGYLLRCGAPDADVALCIHGYRYCGLYEYTFFAPMYLQDIGMDMLIVDDRAHGMSEGKRIGFSWNDRTDCIQWVNWIAEHLGPQRRVLLQGISMGAATVLNASGDPTLPASVRWVVADCSYSSLRAELVHEMHRSFHLPPFPLYQLTSLWCRLLNGFFIGECDVAKLVSRSNVPTLFIHGADDSYVPTSMVYTLFEACHAPKDLMVVPGAQHAESFYENPSRYSLTVREFLQRPDVVSWNTR